MAVEPEHSPEATSPKSEFVAKLEARWSQSKFVCVGLDTEHSSDPNLSRLPIYVRDLFGSSKVQIGDAIEWFNRIIVEATNDLVCAYKPNAAFYEVHGKEGWRALQHTIDYIKGTAPEVPVILDGKRGDIGNTNRSYAEAGFDVMSADAMTVNPYLGSIFFKDEKLIIGSMKPFLERDDKGVVVLVRTSNEEAGEYQDLPIALNQLSSDYRSRFGDMTELRDLIESDVVPLYQVIAYRVAKYWNKYGNVGVVVGATYPEELAQVRKIVGDIPILIPGLGAQEGEAETTVKAGKNSQGQGMIINSSRGIIASKEMMATTDRHELVQEARRKTLELSEEINRYRAV